VNTPAVRDELVATLEEALRLQQRLVDDVRDGDVPVPELVAQVSVIERLDDRRDELIGELWSVATPHQRAARSGQPIREVVLEALAEFRWPQDIKFLSEYLKATRQLQMGSRAYAPLRRDERNAWKRAPEARAYIAPTLNEDGSANTHWLTNSAWDLERRVIASPQTKRLFDLEKILTLAGRPGTAAAADIRPRNPSDLLLERYAEQLLQIDPPPASADPYQVATWRNQARQHVSALIGEIRRYDDPRRLQIADHLADLSPHDRIWGRDRGPRPEGAE
jgi:hypothetical protein